MTAPGKNKQDKDTVAPGPGLPSVSQTIGEAKKSGMKVIGYSCPFIPEELIQAAGILPLRIPLGEDQSGRSYPGLDAFCIIDTCENKDVPGEKFQNPVLSLGLPETNDDYDSAPPAVKSFKNSLRQFRGQLEKLAGRKIKDTDIRRAIARNRMITENLRALYEYPQSETSPISWRDLFEFTQSGFMMDRGRFLAETQKLRTSLEQKKAEVTTPDTRPRLMIAGATLAKTDLRLLDLISKAGGVVVADCTCTGGMLLRKRTPGFSLVENPLDSIVEYYLYNVPGPCRNNLPRRINYVLKIIRDFRVHGLIYYTGKNTCDAVKEQMRPIKDRIYKELLVPTLTVTPLPEGGEDDVLLDRLNSFLDIVGGRV